MSLNLLARTSIPLYACACSEEGSSIHDSYGPCSDHLQASMASVTEIDAHKDLNLISSLTGFTSEIWLTYNNTI